MDPSLTIPVVRWLDDKLWMILEKAAGQRIPREAGDGDLHLNIPVTGMERMTFQEHLVRLPVKLGGLGLRGLAKTCRPAYLAAVLHAAEYLAAIPALFEVWGGPWEDGGVRFDRFRTFLNSGLRQASEVQNAWDGLRAEYREAIEWLEDEEDAGPFAQNAENIGEGVNEGSF